MKKLFEKYFGESEISSKRINVAIFILFYLSLSLVGIFTTWVKDSRVFDEVMEWAMYIIVAYTFGISAVDIFRKKKLPEPQPEPEPKPEDPKPKPEKKNDGVNIDFIKRHEGCKLQSYRCPAGVYTIGYGSTTYADGTPVRKGETITQGEAETMLLFEVNKRLQMMQLPDWINYNQRTALLSWHYNCGHGAWLRSRLRKMVFAKANVKDIYNQWISTYISGGGKVLPGLVRRRKEEAELYSS